MAQVLLEALPLDSARHILDLGCGTGDPLVDLSSGARRAHLVGGDRAEGMVQVARQNVSCSLVVTDAASLALRMETFDVAILAFVLFHVPQPVRARREVWRVLRPNGVVGLVTWGTDPGIPGAAIWKEELDACGAAADPRDAVVMGQAQMDTSDKLAGLLLETGFAPPRIWSERLAHPWTVDQFQRVSSRCKGIVGELWGKVSGCPSADL